MDEQTLAIYEEKAPEYAAKFCQGFEPGPELSAFLAALPDQARVLDLGCGPGRSAAILARHGHKVTATDASPEMIKLANAHDGVQAHVARFEDLTEIETYHGIFANFSLLHADRDALPQNIAAIATALIPNGIFHIGMKIGTGTHRDGIGRRYTFVTEEELRGLLDQASFKVTQSWTGTDIGLAGTSDPWIVLHAVKHG